MGFESGNPEAALLILMILLPVIGPMYEAPSEDVVLQLCQSEETTTHHLP